MMKLNKIKLQPYKFFSDNKQVSKLNLGFLLCISGFTIWKVLDIVSKNKKRKQLTKLIRENVEKKPFLAYSGVKLAQRIRTGVLTAKQIVEAYIDQAKLIDPYINCITDERFEQALKEAEAVDRGLDYLWRHNPESVPILAREKPLLGVPFYASGCFEVPDFSFTCGLFHMRGKKGQKWNPVVWRAKQKGAILLGSGNVSEGGVWYETFNKLNGCSNNPYDVSRCVGGSSGGVGALVGALCAPFALTIDIDGSTRKYLLS